MRARWHRLLRVLIACLAFLVVAAPARAVTAPDVVVLVSSALEERGTEREEKVAEEATAPPPRLAPAPQRELPDPSATLLVSRRYLRLCVLLC
jgi:hypothetical protein